MAKKDLTAAAARGADLFFSAADAHNTQETQNAEHAQQTVKPHKAQEENPAQLAQTVQEMEQAIITQEAEHAAQKQARLDARKAETAARRASRKRLNIELSAAGYDYVKVMAGITGTNVTRFISDLIDKEAETNNATYKAAKELIDNARK